MTREKALRGEKKKAELRDEKKSPDAKRKNLRNDKKKDQREEELSHTEQMLRPIGKDPSTRISKGDYISL